MPEQPRSERKIQNRVIDLFTSKARPDCLDYDYLGALLAEKTEVWQERKYLDMDEFIDWVASHKTAGDTKNVIAING